MYAVVFALKKLHPFLLGVKVTVYTDHSAIKNLLSKNDLKPRLIRCILLLQEFQLKIKDKLGAKNLVADHLSRLENGESRNPLSDYFPDEILYAITDRLPWYIDMVNYIVTKTFPIDLSRAQKEKIRAQSKYYACDEPYSWKFCGDQIIKPCVDESEFHSILTFYHSSESGGHCGPKRTTHKVLECEYYWPPIFREAYEFRKRCEACRKT